MCVCGKCQHLPADVGSFFITSQMCYSTFLDILVIGNKFSGDKIVMARNKQGLKLLWMEA